MAKPYFVTIGIFNKHFTNVPFHSFRRRYYFCAFYFYSLIQFINVINKYRKPCTGISLAIFAKENLHVVFANAAKCWWLTPVPVIFKPKYLCIVFNAF